MDCCRVTNQVSEQITQQIMYLSQLTDMILIGAENGKHTGIISIDLQRAFDT